MADILVYLIAEVEAMLGTGVLLVPPNNQERI